MQLKTIALTLACTMVTGLIASPLPEQISDGFTELFRTKGKNGGLLIYYGLLDGDDAGTPALGAAGTSLQQRASCPTTKEPVCDDDHAARNYVCDQLVAELEGNSDVAVPGSPRQICYRGTAGNNEFCCVSWHNKVPDLNKGDLAGHANKILKTCTSNGISGKIYGVMVGRTCTDVCLSNRGTHC
ncbi:hypothetical protein AJ79_05359 [Helicocarpus griseus UAMH5409]|uniref:WD-like domain-containing protein n=1 Tax=Helicocarpus griseus UAMH5409 TaxID=1447875 RepID=A0A2B7XNX9_9EURO|nr:hypothetical protein AJ79_05359 [Helicocarpus griseus UAMH5409]